MFIHDNICVLGSTEYIVDANDCLLLTVLCVTHQGSTGLHPGIPTSPKNKNMKWQICLTFSFFLNQNSFIFSFFLNFLYQSTLKWRNYFFYLCFYYKKRHEILCFLEISYVFKKLNESLWKLFKLVPSARFRWTSFSCKLYTRGVEISSLTRLNLHCFHFIISTPYSGGVKIILKCQNNIEMSK